MNLADLKAKGAFVPMAPVAKEVTWKHFDATGAEVEDKFTVYVKRQSFGAIESIWASSKDRSQSATYLSQSIRLGEKGKDVMTYDDAFQLDPGLAAVLIAAVNEVNGTGRTEPKN